jgi:hypothetical protein
MDKIRVEKHLQIWTLSADRNEYEGYERLLEETDKHHISAGQLNASLLSQGSVSLKGHKSIVVIHDPSDIRKAYSVSMEKLDKVLSLDKRVISGYHSFNSVGIGEDKQLHLLGCVVHGKGMDGKALHMEQIRQISLGLKKEDSEVVLIHGLDREFDDKDEFELIDKTLGDKFVIRLRVNRVSGLQKWDEEQGKEVNLKLKDAPFAHHFIRKLTRFSWGKKVYSEVKAEFEYDVQYVGDDFYNVVKVVLRNRRGEKIFKQPMLLVSNFEVKSEDMAWFIFTTYLKRSKIEGVFKFLKEEMGWESFQVRDFQAIQNLIVLCFFIGGYFYEIEDSLTQNEWMKQICLLGGGKGKVSKIFFLRGLVKIAHFKEIQAFLNENDLSIEQLEDLINDD